MRQEDYNDMMRYHWESEKKANVPLPQCPKCKNSYLGDGHSFCVECELGAKKREVSRD